MYNAFKKVEFTGVAENGHATSVDFSASILESTGVAEPFFFCKNTATMAENGAFHTGDRSSAKLPRNSGLIENLR